MSYEVDLMSGVAELLHAAGVARWQPSGAYPSGTLPAIFVRVLPEAPDAAISLATYTVRPATAPDDEVIGLQVMIRAAGADPRSTDRLEESVRQVLHNRRGPIGSAPTSLCLLQSGASLGQDGSRRWARSANYYITTARPTPHFR